LIDGTGHGPIENMAIIIDGNRIKNVGLVTRLVTDSCLVVLVVAWTIGNTSAPACEAATGSAEIVMLAI
jgi:hypothetical protein